MSESLLSAAYEQGRRAGIEQAAAEAERDAWPSDTMVAECIAHRIRALVTPCTDRKCTTCRSVR